MSGTINSTIFDIYIKLVQTNFIFNLNSPRSKHYLIIKSIFMKMKNLLLKSILLTITIFIVGYGFSQNCPSGIVSLWNLDDTSEDLFLDHVGIHDASSEVSISSAPGKVGTAKHFTGTQYMSVADHADFDFAANSSFTVECWVNVSSLTAEYSQVFIGKKDALPSGVYWYLGIANSSGKVIWEIQDSDGTYKTILSPSALTLDSWHHLVGVRNEATNTNILYIDGAPVASTTYDYTGNFNSDGAVMMGAFPDNSSIPAYFLDGYLDEVAIYDRALTLADVTEHLQENNYGLNYCDLYSPAIVSTPPNTAIVGKPYLYTVQAKGMPTMTYTLLTGPTGMTIDGSTGVLSWTPASIEEDAWVEIRANNNIAPADTQKFRIFLGEEGACPDNVLLLLKLNETSGTTYSDYYVDHNSTAASVAPTPTVGIVNGGQSFGATTGIIIPDVGDEFEWVYNDEFSIEVWAKTSTTKTMVMIGRRRLSGDYPDKARWWVGTNPSGYPTFSLTDNAATPNVVELYGDDPVSIADGEWHHIVGVRTSGRMKLYVDGVKVQDVSASFDGFTMDVETPVGLGYWYPQYTGQPISEEYHFIGSLDEVAIFDAALTDAQVTEFYNAGAPTGHCAIDNYAPVITSTPVTDATQDIEYSYTFTVEDIDASDIIALSAPTKPDWLTFTYTAGQKSATLSGTPTNDEVGNHDVVLQVTDGTETKTQPFTISVANVNDSPEITSTHTLTGYVGDVYSYVLTATDPDIGTTLTFSAATKPDWLSFNESTGELTGTPAQADKGDHPILLQVSDGEITVDDSFTITVDGPEAIDELEAAGISIFPVPAKDYLMINFDNLTEEAQLDIISASGSVVKKSIIQIGQHNYKIDLNGIETGFYYIRIMNSTLNYNDRFVIAK